MKTDLPQPRRNFYTGISLKPANLGKKEEADSPPLVASLPF
jgi:hypothetical protein